jgi:hypothetical protein
MIDDKEQWGIHEVFYRGDGTIYACTEDPVEVIAFNDFEEDDYDPLQDLQQTLEWMLKALNYPILDYEEIPE